MRRCLFCLIALLIWPLGVAQTYQKAPQPIHDYLHAPGNPAVVLNSRRDRFILAETVRFPSISDLAAPMLRLAGSRINPLTNGLHNSPRVVSYTVQFLDGKQTRIPTPKGGLSMPIWGPRGIEFAFTNTTDKGIELWVANSAKGTSRRIPGVILNAASGAAVRWMPQNDRLLVRMIPANRPKTPPSKLVPDGPPTQVADGKSAPAPTFQDLLTDEDDAKLWEYYATSQLAVINIEFGMPGEEEHDSFAPKRLIDLVGKPGIYASVEPSPVGTSFLVTRTVRPFSYSFPAGGFAKQVEVWDYSGKMIKRLADVPTQEGIPLGGVQTGSRSIDWIPTTPSKLIWVEALDGGNPKTKVDHRDKVMAWDAPFEGQPTEVAKLQHRFAGITYLERGGLALVSENDRDRLWTRTWLYTLGSDTAPKLIWDRSTRDRYNDPGTVVTKTRIDGQVLGILFMNSIFLRGNGASPQGDRPFLDKLDIVTMKTERLFQSGDAGYESVLTLLNEDGTRLLTTYDSQSEPLNYYIRENGTRKPITSFRDSAQVLRGVTKQLVTYKRPDGVDLSFTLYLPANHKQGQRLPTVIWAYPLEFTDAGTAGQVTGSTNRYSTVGGTSPQLLCTQGYAVLMDATIPIIGDPETVNETFVEQLVASAKAAVDKAVDMGVTDRNRVAVMGHSYGAFMTANLLAHSDIFKAGVARSGAYNRTLTPFGFQSERRTLWQAPEMYWKVSPFMHADKIKTPILLIHGQLDNNTGTFPIQSERLFQAIKGNGGVARLVMLPYESHGYAALESMEHVNYETIAWLDKYLKGK